MIPNLYQAFIFPHDTNEGFSCFCSYNESLWGPKQQDWHETWNI